MYSRSFHGFWNCCLIIAMSFIAGCGGGEEKIDLTDISGKATFKGSPIAYGQINFVADSNSETTSPAGYAEIVDGVYNTALGGKGIVPGSYQIRITAYPSKPQIATTETTEDVASEPSVKPLFVGYTLTAKIESGEHNIDVPAEAEGFNLFDSKAGTPRGNLP